MATQRCTVTVTAQPAGSPGPVGPAGPIGPAGPPGAAGAANVLSPYLTPPLVAAALNDEFDAGSPVLGDRGWTALHNGTGEVLTRKGEVTTAAPVLGPTEYNSTIVNGVIRIQATSGMRMTKALSAPQTQVAARFCDPRMSASQVIQMQLTNFAGAPDAESVGLSYGYQWGNRVRSYRYTGNLTGNITTVTPGTDDGAYVFVQDWQVATSRWASAVVNPHTLRMLRVDTPAFAPWTPTRAGFELLTAPAAMSWVEIDYIREYPYGSWFPA